MAGWGGIPGICINIHEKSYLYQIIFISRSSNFLKIFKKIWTFFIKSLLNLLQHYLCFMFWLFWLRGMWGLSAPTRDWTWAPCIRRWSLNHWTTREIPAALQAPLSIEFSSKNTGMGSCSLPQGIFQIQGSNPGLLNCRQALYHLSHQGSWWVRRHIYRNGWRKRNNCKPVC